MEKTVKFIVLSKNIFGRISINTYYPKSDEEYWNFSQNFIDSGVEYFLIRGFFESGIFEEIRRGFNDLELTSLEIDYKLK